MLFFRIALFFYALLFTQASLLALTPQQVVDNVKLVTQVSQDASDAIASIRPSTPPTQIITSGQKLATDFQKIVEMLVADITAMKATPAFPDDVTGPIVETLKQFVIVHQNFLRVVIGKHSILAQFALTAPVAAVLRTLEATIDNFAFAMIDMIPTRKTDVQKDKSDLDGSVDDSIKQYEKVCIPSPLYPTLPPVCS